MLVFHWKAKKLDTMIKKTQTTELFHELWEYREN